MTTNKQFTLKKVLLSLGLGTSIVAGISSSYQGTNYFIQTTATTLNWLIPSAQAADNPQIQQNNEQIAELKSTLAGYQDTLTNLKAQSNPDDTIKTQIANLTSAIDFINKAISTLESYNQAIRNSDDKVKQLEQIQKQTTALENNIANFDASKIVPDNINAIDISDKIEQINNDIAVNAANVDKIVPIDTNLSLEVISNNNRLQTLATALSTAVQPTRIALLQSESTYLNALNAMNKYNISHQSSYEDYNAALAKFYNVENQYLNLQLDAYGKAYASVLNKQVAKTIEAHPNNPVLRQLAESNQNLITGLDTLNSKASTYTSMLRKRAEQLDLATQVSNTIDNQIKILQGTIELNVLINQQQSFLPNISDLQSYIKDITDLRILNFKYLNEQQEIRNQDAYIANLESKNNLTFTADEKATIKLLLKQRNELLSDNIKVINSLLVNVSRLDNTQNNLKTTIQAINDKLNQQDFFVRSTPPVSLDWVKNFINGVQIQATAIWNNITWTLGNTYYYLFGVLSILIGLGIRSQRDNIISVLESLRNKVNVRAHDNLWLTPSAVFISIFTDIHRSFVWGGAALIILNTLFDNVTYLLDYFGYSFLFLLFFSFTMNLLRSGGVINSHYSPKGSFYAKLDNQDNLILQSQYQQPQPRVLYQPLRIFTSSQIAATTSRDFTEERYEFLQNLKRHKGHYIIDHLDYFEPSKGSFDPVKERIVVGTATPAISGDEQDTTIAKVIEAEKYTNIPEAPVKTKFFETLKFTTRFRKLMKATFLPIFVFVNIMYFNLHPAVTPSENIIGQSLYLAAFIITTIATWTYARRTFKNSRLNNHNLLLATRLFIYIICVLPLVLLAMTAAGYVNTTTIVLKHLLYTYYAIIVIIIFGRIISREFAILSMLSSRHATPAETVLTTDEDNLPLLTRSTNVLQEQREKAIAYHNARRAQYFENFDSFEKIGKLLTLIFALCAIYYVWSDLMSVIGYLNNVTIWQVEGTTAGTVQDITLLNALRSLIYILITIFIIRNLKPLLDILIFNRIKLSDGLPYAIKTILTYLIIAIGFSSAFTTLGMSWSKLQWLISALLVGLGFGLQQIFSNFVSGIIILFERPIRINDFITIGSVSGTIKSIRIRATTIIDGDNKEIIIPNQSFVTGSFTNWSLSDSRTRLVFNIGVAYGSDIELVTNTLIEAARSATKTYKEQYAPSAYFSDFGASSLNFVLRCYVPALGDRIPTTHEINTTINRLCNERGIDICFNQLDVYLKEGSGVEVKVDSLNLPKEQEEKKN